MTGSPWFLIKFMSMVPVAEVQLEKAPSMLFTQFCSLSICWNASSLGLSSTWSWPPDLKHPPQKTENISSEASLLSHCKVNLLLTQVQI